MNRNTQSLETAKRPNETSRRIQFLENEGSDNCIDSENSNMES